MRDMLCMFATAALVSSWLAVAFAVEPRWVAWLFLPVAFVIARQIGKWWANG